MKIIRTNYFYNQINKLKRKYPKIFDDLKYFEDNIQLEPFSDLGANIYKFRLRNSSIPVGKRGGFRIIVKVYDDKILPLIIYSKKSIENVSEEQIIEAYENILDEITKNSA